MNELFLFCKEKKTTSNPYIFIEKEVFDLNSKENHFVVKKKLNLLILFFLVRKPKILGLRDFLKGFV